MLDLKYFFDRMWTEKYRPKSLDEVVGHREIKSELTGYIRSANSPHLLFYGAPGTGKTSLAIAFARDLLTDSFEYNFMELNASDERGLDTIRTKIKEFCRNAPLFGKFKIILLDEVDWMTPEAQAALRRVMELYPARFILTANYFDRIVDAIKSRCRCIELEPLDSYDIVERLREICLKEGINPGDYKLYMIAEECNGDLRKAINDLQALCSKNQ